MLDTGQIGPGDDVYFECVARANPSTTIRYSWYHNVSNRFQRNLFELKGFVSGLYALNVKHKLTHVYKITFNPIQLNVFIWYHKTTKLFKCSPLDMLQTILDRVSFWQNKIKKTRLFANHYLKYWCVMRFFSVLWNC